MANPPASTVAAPGRGTSFLTRFQQISLVASALYVVLIACLASPTIQRYAAYQHFLRRPWGAKFGTPEKYGLAPGKTLDFKLSTSDNITLGAWFILSDSYYQSMRQSSTDQLVNLQAHPQPSIETVEAAIRARPTVLYLHGAAGTRAVPWRMQHYSAFTSRLQVNMLSVDYRGFGDSEGSPSEEGLARDAYAAWTWLIDHGAQPADVLVIGHSLGTGVAGKLGAQLAEEGTKARGIVLLAPFSSLTALVETYDLFGFPILQPLQSFALGRKLAHSLLIDAFDTLSAVAEFNVPTLIAHSQVDTDIPHTHAQTLLERLLDPLLPPSGVLPVGPGAGLDSAEFAAFSKAQAARLEARSALVRKVELPNFGTVEQFEGRYGRVVYVETFWGEHAKVGLQEGVQDVIASTFGLGDA